MRIDVRTAFIARDPEGFVWLLKRSESKKLLPGLITGIGGKVELAQGEAEDLEAAARREWREEVPDLDGLLGTVTLALTTHDRREDVIYVLLWYVVELTAVPRMPICTEGELLRIDPAALPVAGMVPTAHHAISLALRLAANNEYRDAVFLPGLSGLVVAE